MVEVTTHGKFRGPDFAPFSFELVAGQSEKLVDSKGRQDLDHLRAGDLERRAGGDREGRALGSGQGAAGHAGPARALAQRAGRASAAGAPWTGEPNKQKVHRVMKELAEGQAGGAAARRALRADQEGRGRGGGDADAGRANTKAEDVRSRIAGKKVKQTRLRKQPSRCRTAAPQPEPPFPASSAGGRPRGRSSLKWRRRRQKTPSARRTTSLDDQLLWLVVPGRPSACHYWGGRRGRPGVQRGCFSPPPPAGRRGTPAKDGGTRWSNASRGSADELHCAPSETIDLLLREDVARLVSETA